MLIENVLNEDTGNTHGREQNINNQATTNDKQQTNQPTDESTN